MKKVAKMLCILVMCSVCHSQNTLGTLINESTSDSGYLLFSPRTTTDQKKTYLIDNCGFILNQWDSIFPLFSTDYLLEDGSLWRSVIDNQSTLSIPGNTGRLEHLDWDGNLIWGATISEENFSFHHDFVVKEDGNILLIVAFRMTQEQAINAGRNPNTIANGELYEERIWEIRPLENEEYTIVWEWRSWDHLIQDFDNTKENFGVIEDHPELIDINFGISFGEADWWHSNSLSYNPERDQITISNRNFDEFIIIDHSTTIEEASSSSGGNSGMGGDILYRYGNPQSYNQGTSENQKLSAMHDVHFIPPGSPNEGKIMIFNNGPDFGFSSIQIIDPDFDEETFTYVYNGGAYGPESVDSEYADPENFFAPFLSGSQELPSGNFLVTDGPLGNIFEVNENEEIVWEYQSPVSASGILEDGVNPNNDQTRLYRSIKYPRTYAAFEGRDLSPIAPIEISPATFDCETLTTETFSISKTFTLHPNPTRDVIHLTTSDSFDVISIFDLKGNLLLSIDHSEINIEYLPSGIYILQTTFSNGQQTIAKVIKK